MTPEGAAPPAAPSPNSVCTRCNAEFSCGAVAGDGACWCAQMPPLDLLPQQERQTLNPLPQRGRVRVGAPPVTTLFNPAPLPTHLRDFARTLRHNTTNAEDALWRVLRGQQTGVKFRRQHPINPYVLDFYCVERRLAIELDGGQHAQTSTMAHDDARTVFLKQQGVAVLRFWNNDVLGNMEGVWSEVMRALDQTPGLSPTLERGPVRAALPLTPSRWEGGQTDLPSRSEGGQETPASCFCPTCLKQLLHDQHLSASPD